MYAPVCISVYIFFKNLVYYLSWKKVITTTAKTYGCSVVEIIHFSFIFCVNEMGEKFIVLQNILTLIDTFSGLLKNRSLQLPA